MSSLWQVTCSRRRVASPKLPLSAAYSSPPERKNPRSVSRMAAASTRSLDGPRPDFGERPAELEHPVELLAVLLLAPPVVVPVLAAAGHIGPYGLDVTVLTRAD